MNTNIEFSSGINEEERRKTTDLDGVYISTYGCQMNENDTERMYALLEMSNLTPVATPEQANVIIINSCSVREKPVHKVRSEVGTYRELKERNPKLKIGVAGCVAQQEKDRILKDMPLVDFVMGTDAIDQLPDLVSKARTGNRPVAAKFEHQKPYEIETLVRNTGLSTFVNIMKGCDNFCTFCVVPFTRGRERSRPAQELIDDLKKLVDRGMKEVTLLGQNVNSYLCPKDGTDFGGLLKRVALETGIQRIRFTTSHPKDFNRDLMQIMKDHRDKICDYIHLPFQSGNTEVLARMNRGYTREEYIEKANMIQEMLPGVALSTDIIVGFPGETEEQFLDTIRMVEEVPFESIFAFKYSPRPFTKAANFEDQVEESVKDDRLQRLFARHNELSFALVKRYEGMTLDVLVEKETRTGLMMGRSTQNKLLHFVGEKSLIGRTVPVKVLNAKPVNFRGELVQ